MNRKGIAFGLALILLSTGYTGAESVGEKAYNKRNELIIYLRKLRPMAYNFPCEPLPECMPQDINEQRREPGKNVTVYRDIKRIYQEGLIYLFERNYVNSYSRFLEAQARLDKLLEDMSQQYIDRTEVMIREAIERQNPNDPRDTSVVDISIDYGPGSKLRRDFDQDREIPVDVRRYDPRNYHYAMNKYRIEANMKKGYEMLGMAKEARLRAVQIGQDLPEGRTLSPDQLQKRIEGYMASIELARQAKINAEFIFALKYPYKNYYMLNPTGKTEKIDQENGEIPTIHGIKMNWSKNPYAFPKELHPLFDLRVPQKWHRDLVDAREKRFDDEIDVHLRFRYHKDGEEPVEIMEDPQGQNLQDGRDPGL